MTTSELKNNISVLLEDINSEQFLTNLYDIISKYKDASYSKLWDRLSVEQQDELLLSEEEATDEGNLIPASEMFKKHQKWH